ncbi:hypothetical protein, partial [Ovoidimarina sediminis]|uniref:hypothetical protein n=1 Tax=Ovoidimarina sediminis TaxID=3079856 RepID=UPI00290E314E
ILPDRMNHKSAPTGIPAIQVFSRMLYRGKEHTWNVTNHVQLRRLASMLGMFQGKTISSRVLSMVSDSDREAILEAAKPNNLLH